MSLRLPDTRQARLLVVGAGGFSSACALIALFILGGPLALAVIATPIAIAAAITLDVTMYAVNKPRARLSKEWHVRTDPLRPAWIRHTLRATGWGARRVGWCLAALLLGDLMLFIALDLVGK